MKRVLVLAFIGILASCENATNNNIDEKIEQTASIDKSDALDSTLSDTAAHLSFNNAIDFAEFCAKNIQSGMANKLASYTENGILLSPYAFIDTSSARIVDLEELANPTKQIHYWGIYAGRGDSILLSTPDYINKFIFNFDLNENNTEIKSYTDNPDSRGSEMINIHKRYPNSVVVEFYNPPTEEGGMDWNALNFVVQKDGGHFILKAIVHNQWTP